MKKIRDFTEIMIMKQGIFLSGTVHDKKGKPVAGARVMLGGDRNGSNYPHTKTDGNGAFKFQVLPGKHILTVMKENFAPDLKVIEFKNEEIERLQKEIADKHGYVLEEHSLVLYVIHKKDS